jgi:hypothetical protein
MRKGIWALLTLALIVVLVACEGGTSGSVIGSSSSCRQGGGGGTCEGRYRTLRGSYGEDIEDESVDSGDSVQVKVDVSVESGRVSVSVETPDGERAGATAEPGQPASLIALAAGEWEGFEVRFEAVEGEAGGVSYTILYELQ